MRLYALAVLFLAPLAFAQVTEVPAPPPLSEPLPPRTTESETLQAGVTIRRDGERNIEEYRVNGELIMVRVVPDVGIPYILMDDVMGRPLQSSPFDKDGPVKPVRYILKEW